MTTIFKMIDESFRIAIANDIQKNKNATSCIKLHLSCQARVILSSLLRIKKFYSKFCL